jgi:hypothetical protein
VNRFVWDMRYGGIRRLESGITPSPLQPGELERSRYYTRGPLVMPGKYSIAVTVNGQTERVTTNVQLDPNLHMPLEQFRLQNEAALAVQKHLHTLNDIIERSQLIQQQLSQFQSDVLKDAALTARFADLLAQAKPLQQKLKQFQNSVYSPDIQHAVEEDDIHALADLHAKVEQVAGLLSFQYGVAPNAELQERITDLNREVNHRAEMFNALIKQDIAAYNKGAYAAGAPTLFSTPVEAAQTKQ